MNKFKDIPHTKSHSRINTLKKICLRNYVCNLKCSHIDILLYRWLCIQTIWNIKGKYIYIYIKWWKTDIGDHNPIFETCISLIPNDYKTVTRGSWVLLWVKPPFAKSDYLSLLSRIQVLENRVFQIVLLLLPVCTLTE